MACGFCFAKGFALLLVLATANFYGKNADATMKNITNVIIARNALTNTMKSASFILSNLVKNKS